MSGARARTIVILSSGPPSGESAARSGVCAVAHTKSAGILSGAHWRASVDARSRRAPALLRKRKRPSASLGRPPSTARGWYGRAKFITAAALRSGCFRRRMKSLVSEQRGPLSLGIPGRIGRAKDPCDAARKHRKSVTTRICRFTHARGDITGVLRSPRYALACRRSAGLLLRNQAHHCLRKHPERSAAAHMSFHRPCQPRAVEGRFRWQVERRRPSTTRLDACAPMRSAQEPS